LSAVHFHSSLLTVMTKSALHSTSCFERQTTLASQTPTKAASRKVIKVSGTVEAATSPPTRTDHHTTTLAIARGGHARAAKGMPFMGTSHSQGLLIWSIERLPQPVWIEVVRGAISRPY
jgi:hypothetical protein